MHPELVHFGPLTIHTYGVLYALGILAAATLAEHLYRRSGGRPGIMMDLAFPTVVGAILGARGLFVLVEHEYYVRHPAQILAFWQGGLVFYGGLAGGVIAFVLTAHRRKLPLWTLSDSAAPGIALGHSIGRLGCFFAGSCYGKPTDVPWAVVFTDPKSLAQDIIGVPVHPTQLYSAAFLLPLSVLLINLGRRSSIRGQVFCTYAISYGLFRFFVEFFRGDPRGETVLLGVTLSTSQWISFFVVPAALALYLHLFRKDRKGYGSGGLQFDGGPGTFLQFKRSEKRI